jgi:hypothetical protein
VYSLPLTWEYNDFTFDPTKRVVAELYDDNELVFSGFFKIDETIIDNGKYSFLFTLFSEAISFYKRLQELYLSDLDFMKYKSQQNNYARMRLTHDTSVIVAPNTTTPNFTAGVPDGFGYLFGLVDRGMYRLSHNEWHFMNMIPQVYFKEVIHLMFEKIGMTIDNALDNEEIYKRLMIDGVDGEKHNTVEAGLRHILFSDNTVNTLVVAPSFLDVENNIATYVANK